MARMSCLLGSPMVTRETKRSPPGQPGRANRSGCRLPETDGGRGGGAARDGQAPPRPDPPRTRPKAELTRRSLLAALAQLHGWLRPLEPRPCAARACAEASRSSSPRGPGVRSGRWRTEAAVG